MPGEYQSRIDKINADLHHYSVNLKDEQARLIRIRERIDSQEFKQYCAELAVDNIRERIQKIVTDEVEKALSSAEEFNNPVYRGRLFKVFEEDDTLSAKMSGNTPTVILEMTKKAGTLEDYANGISYAREIIEAGERRRKYNPINASNYWKNVIYAHKGIDYGTTIAYRVQGFNALAPWWALLDQGVPQPLSSDRGGFPYPTNKATHFVDLIQRSASLLLQGAYTSAFEQELKAWQKFARETQASIRRLNHLIDNLIQQLMAEESGYTAAQQELEIQIDHHKKRFENADPKKVDSLIQAIINQEPIPDRIRLGGGVRVRTKELQKRIHRALGIE